MISFRMPSERMLKNGGDDDDLCWVLPLPIPRPVTRVTRPPHRGGASYLSVACQRGRFNVGVYFKFNDVVFSSNSGAEEMIP